MREIARPQSSGYARAEYTPSALWVLFRFSFRLTVCCVLLLRVRSPRFMAWCSDKTLPFMQEGDFAAKVRILFYCR